MLHPTLVSLRAGGGSFIEQIAQWYQNSTLGELVAYFKERYFTLSFEAYDNFEITEQTTGIINTLIVALMFGLIIASVVTLYYRRIVGDFVRTLIKNETLSPEKAQTLFETGAFRSTLLRRELSHGTFLRKVVYCREEKEFYQKAREENSDATYKMDFTKDHFYIPADLKARAEIRFDKKGSGWLSVIVTILVAPVLGALLCYFLPDILLIVDKMITFFAP